MWALILTCAVFINAIELSSQVKGKRKSEQPPKIAEAFVLDSGHDSQVQPQHVAYKHIPVYKLKKLGDPQNSQRPHGQQSVPVNQYDLNIHSYHHEDFQEKAADAQQAQEAQLLRGQQALLAPQAQSELSHRQAATSSYQNEQNHPLMNPNLFYNRYFGNN